MHIEKIDDLETLVVPRLQTNRKVIEFISHAASLAGATFQIEDVPDHGGYITTVTLPGGPSLRIKHFWDE